MDSLPDGIDSKFRLILVAARRAEQLVGGARAKHKTKFTKPTRIALDEAMQNQINWQVGPENSTFVVAPPTDPLA